MSDLQLPKLTVPTVFFTGVTTGKSFINRLFPVWAGVVSLQDACLMGIDIPLNDAPESYHKVVRFMKEEELAKGSVVTSHKMNIFKHAKDVFDVFGTYADALGEVSCISKRNGKLHGDALDPVTSGLSLDNIVGPTHWSEHIDAQMIILGSGGSALATTMNLLRRPENERPAKIIITGRTEWKVDHVRDLLAPMDNGEIVECVWTPKPEEQDGLVIQAPPHSVVANSTGMGKDRPGSPLSDAVVFPENGVVWDYNFRGDLKFLVQGKAQAEKRNLIVEDGWRYFLHGWSQHLAQIFHFSLNNDLFAELKRTAEELRQDGS